MLIEAEVLGNSEKQSQATAYCRGTLGADRQDFIAGWDSATKYIFKQNGSAYYNKKQILDGLKNVKKPNGKTVAERKRNRVYNRAVKNVLKIVYATFPQG